MAITDKVSKNELARLWDFNPKTISVILDTFRVEWKQNLSKPPFFWGGTILRRLPLAGWLAGWLRKAGNKAQTQPAGAGAWLSLAIFPKYHQTIAKILPKYHLNIAQITPKYCQNITQISPKIIRKTHKLYLKYCQISPKYCQISPKYCRNIARILPKYCPNVVQISPEYCQNIQQIACILISVTKVTKCSVYEHLPYSQILCSHWLPWPNPTLLVNLEGLKNDLPEVKFFFGSRCQLSYGVRTIFYFGKIDLIYSILYFMNWSKLIT